MPLIDVNRLTEDLLQTAAPPVASPPLTPATPVGLPGDPIRALRARTTVRHWAEEPLDAQLLARALRYAQEQDERLWTPAFPKLATPTAAVLVQRVGGVPQGYHHYDPGAAELVPQPHTPPPLADLVLQLEFAQAPVVIVVLGDMAQALAHHGAGGHRLLLMRGAAFAHSIWLSALSEGAAGTVFAGLLSAAGRTELGIDGFRQAQLLGVALGAPRAAEPSAEEGV